MQDQIKSYLSFKYINVPRLLETQDQIHLLQLDSGELKTWNMFGDKCIRFQVQL